MNTKLPSPEKKRLLLCFSPKDAQGKAELSAHLAPARGTLTLWSTDNVPGGESIAAAVKEAVEDAYGALLLLSSDLFAEMDAQPMADLIRQLREQNTERGLLLIPILWRDCNWPAVGWLAALKPLPADGNAIAMLEQAQRDRAFAEIARQLDNRVHPRKAPDAISPSLEVEVHGDGDGGRSLQTLLSSRLPPLLAATPCEPRATLIRAGVPTQPCRNGSLIDQWSYICDWFANNGNIGIISALRVVDQIQSISLSDNLSRWSAEFIAQLLNNLANGGSSNDDGPGRGGNYRDLLNELRNFARNEEQRWREIRRRIEEMASSIDLDALLYAGEMADIWSNICQIFAKNIPILQRIIRKNRIPDHLHKAEHSYMGN